MKEYDAYGRRGSIAAVWCALVGVLMATALVAALGLLEALVLPYAAHFATALTVLFVSAWTLGDLAGRAVCARAWGGVWTGWFLALTCLTLAVFAGSFVTLFTEYDPYFYGWSEAAFEFIYKPLFGVMVFGLIPCAWLAWLFAKLLMRGVRADVSFDQKRHDAFLWKQMWLSMGAGVGIIIGLFCII